MPSVVNSLGFLDSICIVKLYLCHYSMVLEYLTCMLADHASLSTQRYFQGKQVSRVVRLVLDHANAAIQTAIAAIQTSR